MMKSVCEEIQALLTAQDFGLVLGQNLFIARMPDQPINCVCLYDTSDMPDDRTLDNSKVNNATIQVMVRNLNYAAAYQQASDIKAFLMTIANTYIGTTWYLIIRHLSGIVQIQETDTKRGTTLLSMNFVIKRT